MGYADQMREMFRKSNPGLARRFALADAFQFADYSADQLGQILDLKMQEQGVQATSQAREVAMQVFFAKEAYKKRAAETRLSDTTVQNILEPEDFDPHYNRHLEAVAQCAGRVQDMIGVNEI
ncbi:hypothetical protein BJY01DRAFT_250855 [Aspergillus pseudoustus]|uniref:Uncharacterized protein n=1 Tax=Aspergillus pseudoustus TaxID=1810923 RepID=A0ABR4JFH5_9EURO